MGLEIEGEIERNVLLGFYLRIYRRLKSKLFILSYL